MKSTSAVAKVNNPKTVRAWCMYDWANSVYSLVITSAIFPVYYKAVAVTADGSDDIPFLGFTVKNSVLYSYALSVSFLIVAAMLPLLSGISDYTGRKKQFMKMFVFIGSFSCMGLYFFTGIETLWWGLLCSVMASIGYSGSLVFYDAFLPEIVSEDRYDEVSARGYSMGYYGSVILMVACLVLVLNYSAFGFRTEGAATRFSFLLVGIWWILFSLVSFNVLPQQVYRGRSENIWTKGYQEVMKVFRSLKNTPDLKRFLTSFFFYNMGVQTVMYLATLFGTDVLNLPSEKLIATILHAFALSFMIVCWIVVCFAAYFINHELQFYALATVVGMIMGGIQSLSRATYAKLIPENTIDHASYFSFYDVTYNLSIVFGTFSYGLINQLTGSMRNSALALAVYFVIGLIVLNQIKSTDISSPKSISH
ncbi:MAG: MFS transporter [Cyclobacteriaceae bacterium]|nr:MFS transporter [Cyclobacteriaceae bacterium]